MTLSKKITMPALLVLLVSACVLFGVTTTLQGQRVENPTSFKVLNVGENFIEVELDSSQYAVYCNESTNTLLQLPLSVSYEVGNATFRADNTRLVYRGDAGALWVSTNTGQPIPCGVKNQPKFTYTITGLESGTTYRIVGHNAGNDYTNVTTAGPKSAAIIQLEMLIENEQGLVYNDVVRVAGDIDVYLLKVVEKEHGRDIYRRLILNPEALYSYGLRWEDVKTVHSSFMGTPFLPNSAIVTSPNDDGLYMLYPNGDAGTARYIQLSDQEINQAIRNAWWSPYVSEDLSLQDIVYGLSTTEWSSYTLADPITTQQELENEIGRMWSR